MSSTGADPYLPGHGDVRYQVEHYDLDLRLQGRRQPARGPGAARRCRAVEQPARPRARPARARGDLAAGDRRRRGALDPPLVADPDPAAARRRRPARAPAVRSPTGARPRHDAGPGRADRLGGAHRRRDRRRPAARRAHLVPVQRPDGRQGGLPDHGAHRPRLPRRRQRHPHGASAARPHGVDVGVRAAPSRWRPTSPPCRSGATSVEPRPAPVPIRVRGPRRRGCRLLGRRSPPARDDGRLRRAASGPTRSTRYTVVVTDDELEIPLEAQGLSIFGANHLSRDWEAQRLVAHELAHQWFGNTRDRRLAGSDIWLHEGFACYAEWLWSEASGGTTAQREARRHHARLARKPAGPRARRPRRPTDMFDDRVYKRGALTLHALRRAVGDEAFFALLRAWVDTHRFGVVTTADFEAMVRTRTGVDPVALLGVAARARPAAAGGRARAPPSTGSAGSARLGRLGRLSRRRRARRARVARASTAHAPGARPRDLTRDARHPGEGARRRQARPRWTGGPGGCRSAGTTPCTSPPSR